MSLEVGPGFPVDVREKISWHTTEMSPALAEVRGVAQADECVIFCSCERTLILCVSSPENLDRAAEGLVSFAALKTGAEEGRFKTLTGDSALESLLLRSLGADSAIFGEDQILGQMSLCYEVARKSGFTGPVLNRVLQTLVFVARKIKQANPIGRGRVALAGLVFDEIEKHCDGLPERSVDVCIVGWGSVTKTIAHLVSSKVPAFRSLTVANRTPDNVDFPCERVGIDGAEKHARRCAVVVAMASRIRPLLSQTDHENFSWRGKLLVDLGVPRNIDPSAAKCGGRVLDIDLILGKSARNMDARKLSLQSAMPEVRRFVLKMASFLRRGELTSWRGSAIV